MCDCNKQVQAERTPHVHADVIKAWADGAAIQYYNTVRGRWDDLERTPSFARCTEYRVKPEPKPLTDLEKYGVEEGDVWLWREGSAYCSGLVNFVSTRMWYTVIGNGQKFAVLLQDSPLVDGELRFRRGVVNKL